MNSNSSVYMYILSVNQRLHICCLATYIVHDPHLMATLVQTTYSTCWENGLMNENAFIASHTHFCALLRTLYWTVGMGVLLFIAAEDQIQQI